MGAAVQTKNGNGVEQAAAVLLVRLGALRDQAGKTTYERVMLAAQIFADRKWVVEQCGGDMRRAADVLETQYLADLMAGGLTFNQLVNIATAFPGIDQWEAVQFRLPALLVKWKDMQPTPTKAAAKDGEKRRVTLKEYDQEIKKREDADRRVYERETEIERLRRVNVDLENRVRTLERENGVLKGRLEELERRRAG